MATTTVWPKKARPAWKTRMDFDALVEARKKGDGKWPARFANMTKAERGEALRNILGAYGADEEYGPVFDETWAAGRGDWDPYAKSAKRRTEAESPDYENFKYGERMGDLRAVTRTVLGPHYGTDAYPEFRSWIDVLEGRGEARADLPLSKHESIAQDLPEPLQTPYRVAMRGTRDFLTTGASALRALGRSAGLIPEPMPSGAAGGEDFLGRFVERQGTETALDEIADRWRYAGTKARGGLREGLERLGPQALSLAMGSAIYGGALPLVFGADAAQARYDYGRARGETGAEALGKGLAYGAADTALWMVPTPKWMNSRVGPAVGNNLSLFGKGVGSHLLGRAAFGNGDDDEETRQDWEGGEAAERLDALSSPEYSVMTDWGEWAGQDATVRPDPMTKTVALEGRLLPEGSAQLFDFAQSGTVSPEGVPYSALSPDEINANARESGGRAVTEATGDLFALTEREQAEFDRLTKEGVNPRDTRVRALRAMLAAGERKREDVKALAWSERKNRDIAMAKEVARAEEGKADNWQDYYVPTSAAMAGNGARASVAEDVGKRADWLRGRYELREGVGDTRGAERAMDDLKAFRKKARYLARRYGLHPELAKLEADRTLWNRLMSGQSGQRLATRSYYPQNLYVETGRYLTEPSPLASDRDYVMAGKMLDGIDAEGTEVSDELRAWADQYRDRTARWSVWGMPYSGGDWENELEGNFAVPVGDDGNFLHPAPEWLTRHAKRRKKRR